MLLPRTTPRLLASGLSLLVVMTLAGCGLTIPTDPDGTLDRVRESGMRVGISPNPPWTNTAGSDPSGLEVELVEAFAQSLGTTVDWHEGGEEPLMGQLERGELDLVVGGLTDTSPWTTEAVLTKPYAETAGEDGSTENHVMAAPLGENAYLLELERFLLDQEVTVP